MPRYYRRRYTKVVKQKKKWATNIVLFTVPAPSDAVHSNYGAIFDICANSTQVATPVPTILKVGNIKAQMDVIFASNAAQQAQAAVITSYAYVLYVPEGTGPVYANPAAPTSYETFDWGMAFVARHPEWIMGCKLIGSNYTVNDRQNYDRVQFSSRLKRNLNSGDRIVLFVTAGSRQMGQNLPNIINAEGNALVQFWTCAN